MPETPSNPYGVEPPFPRQDADQAPAVDLHKQAAPPPPWPPVPPVPPLAAYPPTAYPPAPYGTSPQQAWGAGTVAYGPGGRVRTRTSGLSAALGWAMLVIGALVIVAAILPWGHIQLADGTACGVRGFDDGNCGPYDDSAYNLGALTILLSVPVIVLGLLRGCIRRAGMALGAAIPCLVLGLLVTLLGAVAPNAPDGLPPSAHFSISYGAWLTLGLGVALVVVSIWGIVRRR